MGLIYPVYLIMCFTSNIYMLILHLVLYQDILYSSVDGLAVFLLVK